MCQWEAWQAGGTERLASLELRVRTVSWEVRLGASVGQNMSGIWALFRSPVFIHVQWESTGGLRVVVCV